MVRTISATALLAVLTMIIGGAAQGPGQQVQGGAAGRRTPARAAAGPTEVAGSAVIRGFVVAAETGQPIRRAQVRLRSSEARESRLATTDEQGRFEARDLPAGRYTITASKGGYVSLQYGQRRPSQPGTPILIGDGQTIERVVVALPRGSVIAGRISDEFGEPIANASVSAMRYGYAGGTRRPMPAGGQDARDTTDDLGQFRLFGLSPGEYYVTAAFRSRGREVTDPGEGATGFAPTYYPGVSSLAEAQRVSVGVGQEAMNISFALIATRLVQITGTVMDSNGATGTGGMVMLLPADGPAGMSRMMGFGGDRIESNGSFRLTSVAPGRYTLQARTGNRQSGEIARLPLTVGAEDVADVVLVTAPGATVSGRVVGPSGQAPGLAPGDVTVAAPPASIDASPMPGNSMARVTKTWTFELTGLVDARLFRVNAPQGWILQAVRLDGRDITDAPIELSPGQKITGVEIVLTDRLTDLSGAVTDANGRPVVDASVVIFPADDRLWTSQSRFIRVTRPDQAGRFQLRGLPPYDDYRIIAVQALENGQGNDPEFLASVRPSAASLRLAEGETKIVDVQSPSDPRRR